MLNIEYLTKCLGENVIRYEYHGIKNVLITEMIHCPPKDFAFNPQTAVVAGPDEISELFSLGNALDNITFFSSGEEGLLIPDNLKCNLVITNLDNLEICQKLDSVMRQYLTWKIRILQALLNTNSPSSVISECSAISGMPVYLLNSRYDLVYSGGSSLGYKDPVFTELLQNYKLSESGQSLISNSDRYVLNGFKLFKGQLHYIVAPNPDDSRIDIKTLVMIAAETLTKSLSDKESNAPKTISFQKLIQDVLTECLIDDAEIQQQLSIIAGRRLNGCWYRCFVLRPDSLDKTSELLRIAKKSFTECFAAEFNGDVILLEIFNTIPPARNKLIDRIEEAAKRYSFRASWHGNFFNLSALRTTYLLTDATLRLDSLLKISDSRAFEYETYSIYNALAMMTEQYQTKYGSQDMVYMLHPHVFGLLLYDRSHGSNLGATLNTYLNCNLSLDDTAKALFVHRNTVTYRLKKIKSMVDIDFGDGNLLFKLRFSFLLKDFLERYKGIDLAKNYTTLMLQDESET